MRQVRRREALSGLGGLIAAGALAGLGGIVTAGCDARRVRPAGGQAAPGTALWRFRTGSGSIQLALAAADDMVYAKGTAPPVHTAVTYGIDAATGQEAWRKHRPAIGLAYAAGDGAVAGFASGSADAALSALDAKTGKPLWTYDLGAMTPLAGYWLLYANGLLYAQTAQPGLVALNMRTGHRAWSAGLAGPFPARWLAEGSGVIYTSTGDGRLLAMDAATGVSLWTVTTRPGLGALVAVNDVVCGLANERAYAFDSATGEPLWNSGLGNNYLVRAAVADDTVFFIEDPADGGPFLIWALDASTGARAWTRGPTRGQRLLTLNTDGDTLYLGMTDGTLLALAAATGKTRWSQRLGAPIQRIVAADEAVYAAGADGVVHAFRT